MEPSAGVASVRAKTSLRLKYEAEARVILAQLGGLEGIRAQLGLSQRRICQLLMVDPSAWTRWLKSPERTPPHVVRALQWYLELENRNPAWQQWREMILKREAAPGQDAWRRQIEARLEKFMAQSPGEPNQDVFTPNLQRLEEENRRLSREVEQKLAVAMGWKLLLLVNTLVLGYFLYRAVF